MLLLSGVLTCSVFSVASLEQNVNSFVFSLSHQPNMFTSDAPDSVHFH